MNFTRLSLQSFTGVADPRRDETGFVAGQAEQQGFPVTRKSQGQDSWNPTSREKRARYGAPGLCCAIRALSLGFFRLDCDLDVRRHFAM
jgi:hypothetical protein